MALPEGQSEMRLALCISWTSVFMYTGFVDSLLDLEMPEGWEIKYFRGPGWCSANRHNHVAKQALDWEADYILFFDCDQQYPKDLLPRMIEDMTVCDAVAAYTPSRLHNPQLPLHPFQPPVWNEHGVVTPERGKLQITHSVGTECLMIRREQLQSMTRPWFYEKHDGEQGDRTVNMDRIFCTRLKTEANITIWVDTSLKIRHLHLFPIDESYQERFKDGAAPHWSKL